MFQLIAAARSATGAILLAGGTNDDALAAGVDLVSTFTTHEIDAGVLLGDIADSWLPMRLRGDLILLAETISEQGAASLITALTALAETCPDRHEAFVVVDGCKELLGVPARRSRFGRNRSR